MRLLALLAFLPFAALAHEPVILDGTELADTIQDAHGRAVIFGHEGDDFIAGLGDHDYLWGGEGNDRLYGGDGADHVHGGSCDFDGPLVRYSAMARAGNYLSGDGGEDRVHSECAGDILDGGAGDDVYDVSALNTSRGFAPYLDLSTITTLSNVYGERVWLHDMPACTGGMYCARMRTVGGTMVSATTQLVIGTLDADGDGEMDDVALGWKNGTGVFAAILNVQMGDLFVGQEGGKLYVERKVTYRRY